MRSWETQWPVDSTVHHVNGTYVIPGFQGTSGTRFQVLNQVTLGDHKSPNPLKFVKSRYECFRGILTNMRQAENGGWQKQDGACITTHFNAPLEYDPPIDSGFTNPYNEAVSKLYDSIRGTQDLTIDGFQLKKLRQTVGDVTHGLTTLSNSWKRITKKHRYGTSDDSINQAMKELGSYYLQWWYGIRPTLMTADALFSGLDSILRDGAPQVRIRTRAQRKVNSTISGEGSFFPSASVSFTYKASVKTSYRAQIDLVLSTGLNRLQTLVQYISLNPVAWAYELTPYSFVLDWALNLSGYMRDLESRLVYADRFVQGSYTLTARREVSIKHVSLGSSDYVLSGTSGGSGEVSFLDRQVLSSMPIPRVPKLDVHLGAYRLAAAAALLSQGLGRKLPFRPQPPSKGGKPGLIWDPRYSF